MRRILRSHNNNRYRKLRVKIQMEEFALILSIHEAEAQLRRLNRDGYSSEAENGLDDEREAWAIKTNYFRHRLNLVRQSLERALSGEFGRCASCNGEIGAKRLNAVPTAIRCLECQESIERDRAGSRFRI